MKPTNKCITFPSFHTCKAIISRLFGVVLLSRHRVVLIISILDTGIPDRRMSPLRSPLRKGSDTDCESANEWYLRMSSLDCIKFRTQALWTGVRKATTFPQWKQLIVRKPWLFFFSDYSLSNMFNSVMEIYPQHREAWMINTYSIR